MFQTLLRDNINPLTGEAFGADFIYTGYIDVAGARFLFCLCVILFAYF